MKAEIEHLFSARPSLLARFKDFYATVWEQDDVPRRVLELCRLRIAATHSCGVEQHNWDAESQISDTEVKALSSGDFSCFLEPEQAALTLADKVPFNHHGVTDAELAAVECAFGAAGAVTLLVALSLFDATCRWKLTHPSRTEG